MKKLFTIGLLSVLIAGCNANNNNAVEATGPFYNERTADFMESDNQYANIDSYKPKTAEEKEKNEAKWNSARMETRWEEYKGAMVRIQILLGNSDIREMRLRVMQNADGMDIDGSYQSILTKVADYEMKRVCGRNVKTVVVVYDEPAFDAMRPTPYFDYRIEAEGVTMREYGFRCIYAEQD